MKPEWPPTSTPEEESEDLPKALERLNENRKKDEDDKEND